MKTHKMRKFGIIPVVLISSATLIQVSSLSASADLSVPQSNSLLQSKYQVAQVLNNCRQVISRNGLYVRQSPTVYSRALGIIESERNVTIKNRGINGWVPISAPLEGYVYSGFLGYCREAAPPPSSCRQVRTNTPLNIYQEPTANGAVVGSIANGRRVTIENRGMNGWVPITVPLVGYISSNYLVYCAG